MRILKYLTIKGMYVSVNTMEAAILTPFLQRSAIYIPASSPKDSRQNFRTAKSFQSLSLTNSSALANIRFIVAPPFDTAQHPTEQL